MDAPAKHNSCPIPGVAGLILAAGKGTRMRSHTPKVLHQAAGRPLLGWVIGALEAAGVDQTCLVLGDERAAFDPFLAARPGLRVAVQKNRAGTGDAVAAAAWSFKGVTPAPYAAGAAVRGEPLDCRYVLIAAGDVPAIRAEALRGFLAAFGASGADVGVFGMRVPSPAGYGRLVIQGAELVAIVEEKDADAAQRRIEVCNTGVIVTRTAVLFELLHALTPANAQREYYLTDIVRHARARALSTMAHVTDDWKDFAGVNDRAQLAAAEEWLVGRHRAELMAAGVTLRLPGSIYVAADVEAGADSEVGAGACLHAGTRVGAGAVVGERVTLARCRVGAGACIGAGSTLIGGAVAPGELVPPLTVRIT